MPLIADSLLAGCYVLPMDRVLILSGPDFYFATLFTPRAPAIPNLSLENRKRYGLKVVSNHYSTLPSVAPRVHPGQSLRGLAAASGFSESPTNRFHFRRRSGIDPCSQLVQAHFENQCHI
jgi:hypothetical protein